ncbi:MAG: hypothetical protein GY733_10200 [bacterium]|nr:hypothetical protein [bacterium]
MSSFRMGYAEVPSFYAAVERLDDPGLRGRPVVVGGHPKKRGKVQSASSDALAAGVTEGMPIDEVHALCPEAVLVRTNMKRYREVSGLLHIALREAVVGIEVDGLAGAFLVLSEPACDDAAQARSLASRLIESVREQLGLPLRVGIAPVKFLARLAAIESGGEGLVCVSEEEVEGFLSPLSPDRLPGVGAKTCATLVEMKIETIAELRALEPREVEHRLGRQARRILAYARGEDDAPVRVAAHPKTLSLEFTFEHAMMNRDTIEERLAMLCQNAEASLRQQRLQADRVAIKVRYDDVAKTLTRTRTLRRPVRLGADLYAAAQRLLDRTEVGRRPLRLLGVSLAGLAKQIDADGQLDLFGS